VVHADLPSNPETLLHRSGRTGRAGAKGVSALIVTPADAGKAKRLLQGARVDAEWGPAPSAEAVQARDDERIMMHPALTAPADETAALAASLLDRYGPQQVAAAFVRLWRDGRSAPEEIDETPLPAAARPVRDHGAFGDSVWFALSVGHKDRAEARWLLPRLCEAGGITRDAIGAIRVREDETFVQIATASAAAFGSGGTFDDGVVMRRLDTEPSLDRHPPRTGARPRTGTGKGRGNGARKSRPSAGDR
jgi:ATP-dependent RNA helicase DeaD